MFSPGDVVTSAPVLCPPHVREELSASLMLFFTGATRDSSKILTEQESTIPHKMARLDRLVGMVDEASEALRTGDTGAWGELLDRAWQEKRQFASGVTNELIDGMYDAAREAGAVGGKVLGAGGGGFLLLFVPPAKQPAVRRALAGSREVPFSFNPNGTQIVFVD